MAFQTLWLCQIHSTQQATILLRLLRSEVPKSSNWKNTKIKLKKIIHCAKEKILTSSKKHCVAFQAEDVTSRVWDKTLSNHLYSISERVTGSSTSSSSATSALTQRLLSLMWLKAVQRKASSSTTRIDLTKKTITIYRVGESDFSSS